MSLTLPFLHGPVFFQTALPYSRGYYLERGGMPLHDAVGINCENGKTTGNQAQMSSTWAKGCMCYLT